MAFTSEAKSSFGMLGVEGAMRALISYMRSATSSQILLTCSLIVFIINPTSKHIFPSRHIVLGIKRPKGEEEVRIDTDDVTPLSGEVVVGSGPIEAPLPMCKPLERTL